jgi:hypothetical protein
MIPTMNTASQLIDTVERARAEVIATTMGLTAEQASFKPSPGEWSITENIEHLYLAEMSGLAKIWTAARQVRSGTAWTGPRPNNGRSIEDVIAATWKAKELAPEIATPHIGGPLEFWIQSFGSLTGVLNALGRELEGLDLESIVFPHFLSGPLDGRQRLEFLRFHMERHHDQIQRIRAHPALPR